MALLIKLHARCIHIHGKRGYLRILTIAFTTSKYTSLAVLEATEWPRQILRHKGRKGAVIFWRSYSAGGSGGPTREFHFLSFNYSLWYSVSRVSNWRFPQSPIN